MYQQIEKKEYLKILRKCLDVEKEEAVALYPQPRFEEPRAIFDFGKKNPDCRIGRIVVHNDVGLTQRCIYLKNKVYE